MKKRIFSIVFILVLLLSCSATAFAQEWTVIFTEARQMEGNLNTAEINDIIERMEPGDTETFQVKITNMNSKVTRWYMENLIEKTKTLEATGYSSTTGGAYSYLLTYTDSAGVVTELYNSEIVGGDQLTAGREGLREATTNLESYFFLDTLNPGESGLVTLTVSLEGETQGNAYQNTYADIVMRFAVELPNSRTAVRTGDENNLTPYYIVMTIAGLLFLYLALDAITDRLYKKGKG